MILTLTRGLTDLTPVSENIDILDRGVVVVSVVFGGGPSLYCLHFGINQLMGPEACFERFVRVLLG